ncbi:hypothetical protein Ocin01_20190, partial [Orchesella cincta]
MEAALILLSKNCGFTQLTRAIKTEDEAIEFFKTFGLLNLRRRRCTCGSPCLKLMNAALKLKFRWQCASKSACGMTFSAIKGTLFEGTHLSFLQIYDILLHFFFRQNVRLLMVDCGVSEHTCIKWRDTFREVCHTTITKYSTKIGGLGKFVEVDEAHLFRRKYNRGHRIQGESVWILGGICRESKERFVVRIAKRNRASIYAALQKNVLKGSILVTDDFVVYHGVDKALGFLAHETVVHRTDFVNPIFREIFTNTIECVWGKLKRTVRRGGNL